MFMLGGVHKLRLQDLAFFDHLPPSIYIFYGIKVYKNSIFLTTYPPPLVNVVCECPLTVTHSCICHITFGFATCDMTYMHLCFYKSFAKIVPIPKPHFTKMTCKCKAVVSETLKLWMYLTLQIGSLSLPPNSPKQLWHHYELNEVCAMA